MRKKVISIILFVLTLSAMVFSFTSCSNETEKKFERQFIRYELFNEEGELVGDYKNLGPSVVFSYGVYRYKYNGKPCKLTVDMIELGTGKRYKNYDQIIIGFYKYNEETNLPEHIKGGGFQSNELKWPSEVGTYDIHIDINQVYENIDGKEYDKYHSVSGYLTIIIEG